MNNMQNLYLIIGGMLFLSHYLWKDGEIDDMTFYATCVFSTYIYLKEMDILSKAHIQTIEESIIITTFLFLLWGIAHIASICVVGIITKEASKNSRKPIQIPTTDVRETSDWQPNIEREISYNDNEYIKENGEWYEYE